MFVCQRKYQSETVIHTVGPIVYGAVNDELGQELRNCYENVFKNSDREIYQRILGLNERF
ncbi:MAG: macro domain-containing protein [Candidatus Fimousia sp.]